MNTLIWIAALIIALLAMGASYEFVSSLIDRQRYKSSPGECVDVGGHALHILGMGSRQPGQPAVVLDAGVSGTSLDWQKVQPRVAEFAQVVSYDRAGYGWSDKGPEPRTPQRIVEELHTLLHKAEIEAPYILVGHSFGGIYVRLFAEIYPDEVVGLVLVESSNPSMIKTINTEPEIKRLKRVALFKRIGLVRLMLPRLLSHTRFLDGAARRQYLAFYLLDSDNVIREAGPMYASSIQLSDKVSVPLTVISREPFEELESERRWQEYQQELVALSPQAKHIHTQTSSHYIALAEPETVVQAIREMLQA